VRRILGLRGLANGKCRGQKVIGIGHNPPRLLDEGLAIFCDLGTPSAAFEQFDPDPLFKFLGITVELRCGITVTVT
jgi:hypothetical protein